MKLEFKKLDSLNHNFEREFSKFESQFHEVLSKSYLTYFGQNYHANRIRSGKAIVYLGFADAKLIAASYVKRNRRRGAIAVYPESYRRLGLAKAIIQLSLKDFPNQYTIISTNLKHSHKMISLLKRLGFTNAISEEKIKKMLGGDFNLLSNFRFYKNYFVFDRNSERRKVKRKLLTLFHAS